MNYVVDWSREEETKIEVVLDILRREGVTIPSDRSELTWEDIENAIELRGARDASFIDIHACLSTVKNMLDAWLAWGVIPEPTEMVMLTSSVRLMIRNGWDNVWLGSDDASMSLRFSGDGSGRPGWDGGGPRRCLVRVGRDRLG